MPKTLQQLIKDLKFDYTNSSIIEANFPTTTKGKVSKIFEFDHSFTREEAIKKLDEEGYRPATAWELLNWAVKNWNGKDYVVALGQEIVVNGDAHVVWCGAGERGLFLFWAGGRCFSLVRVAGVRKSLSKSDTSDSLKLGNFDLDGEILEIKGLKYKLKLVK